MRRIHVANTSEIGLLDGGGLGAGAVVRRIEALTGGAAFLMLEIFKKFNT